MFLVTTTSGISVPVSDLSCASVVGSLDAAFVLYGWVTIDNLPAVQCADDPVVVGTLIGSTSFSYSDGVSAIVGYNGSSYNPAGSASGSGSSTSTASSSASFFNSFTVEDGAQIAGAILAVWAAAWCFRVLMRVLNSDGVSSYESE